MAGLILSSCVDEFWPGLDEKYDEIIVVDGCITNTSGPHLVELSLSSSLEKPIYHPLIGCSVKIMNDQGTAEILADLNNGKYMTKKNGIQGIPGRSYKIIIVIPDGNTYESNWEKMQEPVEIDTVWAEYETVEDLNYDHLLEGYRFKITTGPSEMDSTYFLWRLYGTFQYTANHNIHYVFDGEMKPFPHYDSLKTCWMTYQVPEIFTFHTQNLAEPVIRDFPLHYVNTEDRKLSIRYSLYTEQYVISKATHEYWKHLKEQNNNLGSVYAVIPFQVKGNIRNTDNPDELVLGYFMAASVTGKRIFVDRPWYANFYYLMECYLNTQDFSHQLYLMRNDWPVYLAAVFGEYGQSPALPANQSCVNCTKSGGTIIQPDFWINSKKWEQ